MGGSFKIGGQKFSKTDMPSDFNITDVKSKKMQRTLNLFDVDGDGIISKDEAEKISLFYETGSATFSKTEDGQITDYTISAKKAGKNPIATKKEVIDEKSDNMLYSEHTTFNRRVKEKRTDQYRYEHKADGSVDEKHDVINKNDQLVQTETSLINKDNAFININTFDYQNGKNGEVNVTKTNYPAGTTEHYKYWTS